VLTERTTLREEKLAKLIFQRQPTVNRDTRIPIWSPTVKCR